MKPPTTTPRVAARRWGLGVIKAALVDLHQSGELATDPQVADLADQIRALLGAAPAPATGELVELAATVARIEANQDHLHDDLVALREWCRIPRPECYPDKPPRKRRAERAQEE